MKKYENENELLLLVASNLKRIRQNKKLSQEELGFRCGISKNYVSDFERGKRNITIKVFQKIVEGLGVQPEELLKTHSK
ncbi:MULTISPECIES: helix-turn-helix domain-containing protein [Mesoplasma]|uniref:Transcriptional regulator Cro/CI family n=2 Tax=Mesoplasma florum TaxID=2151 RepID=Q6F250_MESFL|nr:MULTISPECIES: helix-turn-helix transcriptional regulator [Mesoplasma]AAT75423.1 transcriptional regulator Cro/CI family [Mesoplasma florum L1]ATI73024.1 XRE family transcriptional regulator [Mesoplasma florum]ATI73713.1 XRE family transcriptional regulator [Mesoplasma florum]AVN60750.1 XRE family transcriptional regulator [Mesoplasma florum]AVN61427.1 XRE family transcriptional regulator [Mesoplasma florum]